MVIKHADVRPRNFSRVVDMLLEDGNTTGEISLAAFLIEHAFVDRTPSIGAIGSLPLSEALAFNSLVSQEATFVVLGYGSLDGKRGTSADLARQIERCEFEVHAQFADLTLPGRWPQILTAMARTRVGILAIDANWGSVQPDFWKSLQQFKSGESIIFIRGLLDYRNAQALLPLLSSMPAKWEQNLIAMTPNSIWFASSAESAAIVRQVLRESGLFSEDNTTLPPG